MDERGETDKMDEIMLPGFRFHPTDEELVGFYLKRKVQQRPLSIEIIKQLDIYKFDPWDLPKMATTGEKEWYFYCPRDRKYRNSARPNRVTGAGFWKATGTDRPIYSSEGSKCIGLKKSLVFYKGRAAKGIKTDWMMHEFRLPSSLTVSDSISSPHKRFLDKNIPPNESWAICRIFKKTISTAQRGISQSWVSPILPETTTSEILSQGPHSTQFTSENMSLTPNKSSSAFQFSSNNDLQQSCITTSFSPLYVPSYYKPINHMATKPLSLGDLPTAYPFSSLVNLPGPSKCTVDAPSMFLNMSSTTMFGDFGKASECTEFSGLQEQCNGFSIALPQEMQGSGSHGEEINLMRDPNGAHFDEQWGTMRSVGIPFSLPSNLVWDSSPCPSEMSTSFSTNKCYS
ncbi:unnamed protein product [Camellia sinensis]